MPALIVASSINTDDKAQCSEYALERLRLQLAQLTANLDYFASKYDDALAFAEAEQQKWQQFLMHLQQEINQFGQQHDPQPLFYSYESCAQEPTPKTKDDLVVGPQLQVSATTALSQRCKKAFRLLARRFHPDLAVEISGLERQQRHQAMVYLNHLMTQGEFEKILALAAYVDDDSIDSVPRWDKLYGQWLTQQFLQLQSYLRHLQQLPLYSLWQQSLRTEMPLSGFLKNLVNDVATRTQDLRMQVDSLMATLERCVDDENKKQRVANKQALVWQQKAAIAQVTKQRFTVGLQGKGSTGYFVAQQTAQLQTLVQQAPMQLQVVLLAYVTQLHVLPLLGFETYQQLERRFAALYPEKTVDFAANIIAVADILRYRAYQPQQTGKWRCGLVFVQETWLNVIEDNLKIPAIYPYFVELLHVLGEYGNCRQCQKNGFAVPLCRLSGLEIVHGTVCSQCHYNQRLYMLPCGVDIVSVLNHAYLEAQLVYNYQIGFAGSQLTLQLSKQERCSLKIGDFIQILMYLLFQRHQLGIKVEDVQLLTAAQAPLAPTLPLLQAPPTPWTLIFSSCASYTVTQALSLIQQQIAARFAPV